MIASAPRAHRSAGEEATHRELLRANKVSVSAITDVNSANAAPRIAARSPASTTVRILNWNLLADGLSDDGFAVRDVLAGGAPTNVEGMITELMATKRDGGDMASLRAKHCTERSSRNLSVVIDWKTRWARMRAIIEKLQPDVMTFQELDHFADAPLTCARSATSVACASLLAAKSCHAAGVEASAPLPPLSTSSTSMRPASPSHPRRTRMHPFSLERGYNDPDGDGVAIFWRVRLPCVQPVLPRVRRRKALPGVVRVKLERRGQRAAVHHLRAPRCRHQEGG